MIMIVRTLSLVALGFCLSSQFLAPDAAGGEVARFAYEALVTSVDVPNGHPVQGRLKAGDKISGSFQYDLGLRDYFSGTTALGSYEALPAGYNRFRATGGNGFVFDSAFIERPFFVATVDNGQRYDTLLINMSGDTAPSTLARSDTRFVEVGLLLETANTSVFRTDALPRQLSLSSFELAGLDFFGTGTRFPTFLVHTRLTSLSTLPSLMHGDFNANGQVEQRDLDMVLTHWGKRASVVPATWLGLPPIGHVDQAELDAVLLNWGVARAAATAVPEPAACGLVLILAASVLATRLRRGRKPR